MNIPACTLSPVLGKIYKTCRVVSVVSSAPTYKNREERRKHYKFKTRCLRLKK